MNINASIIDQRIQGLKESIRKQVVDELGIDDETRLRSLAFVYLCVKTMLDLDDEATFECITEGSGDFGVDAIHITTDADNECSISIFQGKYKNNLEANAGFPTNAINKLISALNYLFDPFITLDEINPKLQSKLEEARSFIREGYIPNVKVFACNNGTIWHEDADASIQRAYGDSTQITWQHVNHDRLVEIMQNTKPVDEKLIFSGKSVIEDMKFNRAFVGKMSVNAIAELISKHGNKLLERNIRRYLGLHGNRVNQAIKSTLLSDDCGNFYFYNNGITLVCDSFSHNGLQAENHIVQVKNLQIINGGQTCMTIYETLNPKQPSLFNTKEDAFVLVRLYALSDDNEDFINRITFATNSQNPVDLKDLKANDERQKKLELDIKGLGYTYKRKRNEQNIKGDVVTSGTTAEAVLSVWRDSPHQAKFFTREHFGKLYDKIFTDDLNGSQVITSVLLYRLAENRRKRPENNDPSFVRYGSCFFAMQMGKKLLGTMGKINLKDLNHLNFATAKQLIESHGDTWLNESITEVAEALKHLYGTDADKISMQQLSATFRRGDLIATLSPNSQNRFKSWLS
jgi:hypothetical protein